MAGRPILGQIMTPRLVMRPSIVRSLAPLSRQVRSSILAAPHAGGLPNSASRLHTTSLRAAQYRRFGDRQQRDPEAQEPLQQQRQPWSASPDDVARRIAAAKPLFGRGQGSRMGRSGYGWITIIVAGGVTYYVIHLERVPETGRLRFMDISVAAERQLGEEAFQQTLRQYRGRILPPSDRRVQMVTQVAHRIVMAASHQQNAGKIDASHMPDGLEHGARHGNSYDDGDSNKTAWEVFVVQDDTPNAFVLPNGKIFVFTGILPICHDADGLATVLGHEIAHQVARHGAEKVAGSRILLGVGILVSAMVGYDGGITRMLLHFAAELPHSRTVELEADKIGLRLMSAACFDPTKAPKVWERMQQMEKSKGGGGGGAGMELLSTHPVSSKRQKNMEDWMQEALQIRSDSECPSASSVSQFQSIASRPNIMGAFAR